MLPYLSLNAAATFIFVVSVFADRIPSGDHTVGPKYDVDPALTDLGNPPGTFFSFLMKTNLSNIYNGTSPTFVGAECHGPSPGECCHKAASPGPCAVNWERNITVYVPSG